MNPKNNPKSELTLSAVPQVDRRVTRIRDAVLAAVVLAILIFVGSLRTVNAAPPPLPMPSPWPSGIVHSCGVRCPVPTPSLIPLPNTDTLP